jgi:hypothetical protein
MAHSAGLVAVGAVVPHFVPSQVLGVGEQPPSETLTFAAVGIGGMEQHYLDGCKGARVVALCDADHNFAGKVFEKYPGAPWNSTPRSECPATGCSSWGKRAS